MIILYLVSGNGGNLKFINQCINKGFIKGCNLFVIADRECGALNYSKENNINYARIQYSRNNNDELINLIEKIKPDLIVTNIHKILDEKIVKMYSNKMINLHYSLLPAYAGLIGETTIIEAMKYSKFIGITLHLLDEKVDNGEIIIQGVVRNNGDKSYIINEIFRMGCLSLLYHICLNFSEIVNENILERINSDKYIFSPDLNFDVSFFDDEFWDELRGNK